MIIMIGHWTEEYELYKTNAPIRYDYDYCITVYGDDTCAERYVLIPIDNADYQLGRYASGLYQCSKENDEGMLIEATERLYQRMRTNAPSIM